MGKVTYKGKERTPTRMGLSACRFHGSWSERAFGVERNDFFIEGGKEGVEPHQPSSLVAPRGKEKKKHVIALFGRKKKREK